MKVRCGAALLVLALALPASGASFVDLLTMANDLVADPVRPEIVYVSAPDGTVMAVDVVALRVTRRMGMLGTPGSLAVSPDGAMLFAAIPSLRGVQPIDLASWAALPLIATSETGDGPAAIEADGCGRVFAAGEGGLSVLDVATGAETWFGRPDLVTVYWDRGVYIDISPDGRYLFVDDWGSTGPESYWVVDVTGPTPQAVGHAGERDPIGKRQAHALADGRTVVLTGASSEGPEIWGFDRTMWQRGHVSMLGGSFIAPTPDGRWIYGASPIDFCDQGVEVGDVARGLSTGFWLTTQRGCWNIVLTADGARVVVVTGRFQDRIEVFDTNADPPRTYGTIRWQPVDAVTRQPIEMSMIGEWPFLLDAATATWTTRPFVPGPHHLHLQAIGYDPIDLDPIVVGGESVDLGELPFTRVSAYYDGSRMAIVPPARAGATTDVTLHGYLLQPDATLTSLDPAVTVDSIRWVSPDRMDATITVAASIVEPAWVRLEYVANADTMPQEVRLMIAGEAATRAAGEVALLRVDGPASVARFSWSAVVVDAAGGPMTPSAYQIRSATRADFRGATTWRTVSAATEWIEDVSAPGPLTFYKVRAVGDCGVAGAE